LVGGCFLGGGVPPEGEMPGLCGVFVGGEKPGGRGGPGPGGGGGGAVAPYKIRLKDNKMCFYIRVKIKIHKYYDINVQSIRCSINVTYRLLLLAKLT